MAVDTERLMVLQLAYWTYRAEEHGRLQQRAWEELRWPERLRLHHLNCLELLERDPWKSELEDETFDLEVPEGALDCQRTSALLLAEESPYRARSARVWQTSVAEDQTPSFTGPARNASATHLGCLEVITLDADRQPEALAFLPYEDLTAVVLSKPAAFRAAIVCFAGETGERVVYVPQIYGITWRTQAPHYRTGQMTRFLEINAGPTGIGLGQQDLMVESDIFALGTVGRVEFTTTPDAGPAAAS